MLWKYLSTTVFESLMMSLDSPGSITEYWQMELMKNVFRAPPRDGDTMIAAHWREGSACPWSETRSRMGVPICANCQGIVSQLQIDSPLPWFVILELDPVNISPLPTGQMLTSSQEGLEWQMPDGDSAPEFCIFSVTLLCSGPVAYVAELRPCSLCWWPLPRSSSHTHPYSDRLLLQTISGLCLPGCFLTTSRL